MNLAGFEMAKNTAEEVFKKTKVNKDDIVVCELHDCFAANEMITYEAL